MADDGGLQLMQRIAEGGEPMPPVASLLGWKLLAFERGVVRVQYAARSDFNNPQGNVQGGILAAMLDDAMGPAALTTLGSGEIGTTVEMKVNFMTPVRDGRLIAEGRVTHKGRSIVFVEGSLRGEDDTLVATASATLRIVRFVADTVPVPDA